MKPFQPAFITFILVIASGCSLSSSDGEPSLHIDLSALEDRSGQYSLLESNGRLSLGTPPASLTGFKCYAVNVTGPGIADSSRNPSGDPAFEFYKTLTIPDYTCAYRGVVSPPIIASAGTSELALKIPPGGLRLVQVVGVDSQYMCDTGIQDDEPGSTESSEIYELGRAVLRDVFQDQSVSISANWPTGTSAADQLARLAKKMDCGDGNCGFHANLLSDAASTPAKSITNATKVAQRLDVSAGLYLRRIDVELNVSVGGAFEVAICEVATGAAPAANCEASSSFKSSRTLLAGSAQIVSFELRHSTMGYLRTQAGSDYYLVLRGTSVGASAEWPKVVTTGASYFWSSGVWSAQGTSLYRARVVGCGP